MKRICKLCGKEFETKSSKRSYCYEHDLLPCYQCGKLFKPSNYQRDQYIYYNNKHIYCSKKCKDIGSVKTYKETMTNKYGVDSVFKVQEFKEKGKQTLIQKYKNDSIAKEIMQEKARNTMVERYGVPYAMQNEDLKEKYKQNYIKNHGVDNPQKLKEVQEKTKETKKEKYGDENYNNREKARETCNYKYKRTHSSQEHLSEATYNIISNKENFKNYILSLPEKQRNIPIMAKLLNYSQTQLAILFYHKYNLNEEIILHKTARNTEHLIDKFIRSIYKNTIIYNTRSIIPPYELDIYIPDKKVAIEFNGVLYHNSTINPYNDIPKDKNYHYMKSKLCEEKGIRLIHIYEYEWFNERQRPILESIIKNALGITEHIIYARQCKIEIKQSKEMKQFFNDNNIQGFRGGSFSICLVDKKTNEIYMAYMFGKAFFGKGKYEWEVIRGATKLNYSVIGGASKIWNYFIKNYNPKSIVYYIDYNYFNGNSLPYLGLKYIKTQPSFKNYFIKEKIVKNRDPMHHKDIVKGYEDGSILQIWNAGTKVYVWENN